MTHQRWYSGSRQHSARVGGAGVASLLPADLPLRRWTLPDERSVACTLPRHVQQSRKCPAHPTENEALWPVAPRSGGLDAGPTAAAAYWPRAGAQPAEPQGCIS